MVGSAAVKTAVKTVPCQLTVVTCQGWFMPTLSGRHSSALTNYVTMGPSSSMWLVHGQVCLTYSVLRSTIR